MSTNEHKNESITNEEEEEEDDDEIIDNSEDENEENNSEKSAGSSNKKNSKEDSIIKLEDNDNIKSANNSNKNIDQHFDEISKIEPQSPKKNNQKESSPKDEDFNIDNMNQDEVLAMLLNSPIDLNHNDNEVVNDNKSNKEEEVVINIKEDNDLKEQLKNNLANIELEEKNFDNALKKILNTMIKDNANVNENIYDILVNDKDIIEKELIKMNESKKVDIPSKVKKYIEKKEEKLKALQQKSKDEFNQIYTFTPSTYNKEKDTKKRNMQQFLKDQEDYQKKKKQKLDDMKDEQDQLENKELKLRPKICETSKKIANEKNKGEEVYKRLYNHINKKTETIQIKKVHKTSNSCNTEKFNDLYNEAKKREEKLKKKEEYEKYKQKVNVQVKTNNTSNKYLFNKFKSQFYNQIENVLIQSNNTANSNISFNFVQLKNLFFKLNFINAIECKSDEDILLNNIFEVLKDNNNTVKIEHIFIFCLSILNLFEYYLLSNSHLPEETSKKSSTTQTDILNQLNSELTNKIINHKKYGGYDKDNNFIITLNSSKVISKEFNILYKNYSSAKSTNSIPYNNNNKSNYINKIQLKRNKNRSISGGGNNINKRYISKPNESKTIDYSTNNTKKNYSTNHSNAHLNMRRIEQLYKESAKKQSQKKRDIEKYKQIQQKKEMELCTFKPKINPKNPFNEKKENQLTQEERIELLYKKGTEKLMNKSDKTKEENELDKYKTEYTFKPNIHEINHEIFDKKNSVYQDEDVYRFNKRLKQGRDEKEYKDSYKERGELFINRNIITSNDFQNNLIKSQNNSFVNKIPKHSFQDNILNNNVKKSSSVLGNSVNINNNLKGKNSLFKQQDNINKHNNERPILEIDVNLKHGIKKKVIVYEGDTADKLAENFADENSLDNKMKNKLQKLIQQELDKLLIKIQEESISSYKSNPEY